MDDDGAEREGGGGGGGGKEGGGIGLSGHLCQSASLKKMEAFVVIMLLCCSGILLDNQSET